MASTRGLSPALLPSAAKAASKVAVSCGPTLASRTWGTRTTVLASLLFYHRWLHHIDSLSRRWRSLTRRNIWQSAFENQFHGAINGNAYCASVFIYPLVFMQLLVLFLA